MTSEFLIIAIMILKRYVVSVVVAENTKSYFSVVYNYINVILVSWKKGDFLWYIGDKMQIINITSGTTSSWSSFTGTMERSKAALSLKHGYVISSAWNYDVKFNSRTLVFSEFS